MTIHSMTIKHVFGDERYVIIIEPKGHYVDVDVYEDDAMQYANLDTTAFVTKMLKEDIKPCHHGSVKWDGCMDINYNADGILTHFCDPEGMQVFFDMNKFIMAECYRILNVDENMTF